MPESAHKKRLVAKLNEANGRGTPEVATSGSVRTIGKMRSRRKSGDGFINLLTPRRKRPAVTSTGSYSVKSVSRHEKLEQSHSFRRQNSLAAPAPPVTSAGTRTLSPQPHSSPAVLSPYRDRLPSPPPTGETPVSQASEVCPVDEVDTPGKESEGGEEEEFITDDEDDEDIPDHDGSYITEAPPLPPRTPNPMSSSGTMSPMSLAITTPRHRGGLMLCSKTQLDRWKLIMDTQQSPCQPQHYNEDEPEETGVDEDRDEAAGVEEDEVKMSRNRSLSNEFKEFLSSHGMEAADTIDTAEDESEDSVLEISNSNYSEEVRRLLGKNVALSTSLQAAMDGEEPEKQNNVVLGEISNRDNNTKETATKKETVDNKPTETDLENVSPVSVPRRGTKRRSITECGPGTPASVSSSVQSTAIIFETDL